MFKIKKVVLILSSVFLFIPVFWNSYALAGWWGELKAAACPTCGPLQDVVEEQVRNAIKVGCKKCQEQSQQCVVGTKIDASTYSLTNLNITCKPFPTDQLQLDLSELEAELSARKPIPRVSIPGLNFSNVMSTTDDTGTYFYIPWIPELIAALYKFGIAAVSIIAVVVIILQGVRIVTSAGGEAKQSAYKKILQSVIGLAIAWGSFAILYNVNPNLIKFNALRVKVVERIELSTENSGEVITDLDMAAPREGTNGVPLFKQGDFPTTPYGKCGTVKSTGCGPSSMAMVMKYYGADVDPVKVATLFAQEGYRACPTDNCDDCQGTDWSAFTKSSLLAQYGLKAEEIAGEKRMLELLKDNHPLIAAVGPKSKGNTSYGTLESFTKGGHFIVITGVDANGSFLINDPAKAITVSKVNDLLAGLKGVWHVYGDKPATSTTSSAPLGCCSFTTVRADLSDTTEEECYASGEYKGWTPGSCS